MKLVSYVAALDLLFSGLSANGQPLAGGCAHTVNVGGITYFSNQCSYPVYWKISCSYGTTICFGGGLVYLASGGTGQRNLSGNAFDIWGPHRAEK
jgi:hypothetical protein